MDNKERKIGEILKGQKFDLDKEALWTSLEGSLPEKENKRRGIWWFFLLLIPITIGAYMFNDAFSIQIDEILEDENKMHYVEKVLDKSSEESDANDQSTKHESQGEGVNESYGQEEQEISQEGNGISGSDQEINSTKIIGKKTTLTQEINDEKNIEGKMTINNRQDEILDDVALRNPAYNSENQAPSKTENKIKNIFSEDSRNGMLEVSILDSRIRTLSFERSWKPLELRNNLVPTLCCIDQRWSLAFVGGVNKSFNKISGIEDRETGVYGSTISFIVDRKIKSRWSLSGGFSFDQLASRYTDIREVRSVSSKIGVSELEIDALGQAESVQGPVQELILSKRDISWHRRQKSIDLQLSIKRDLILSYSWKIGLSGGIAYNLYTETKGYGYSNDENHGFYKFNIDTENLYKKSTGIKPLVGLDLSYRYKKVEIVLQANYKWNLEPINTHTEHYQLKHSQTGIQLGTRYNLNGN